MLLAAVEDKLEDWVSSKDDIPLQYVLLYTVATRAYR